MNKVLTVEQCVVTYFTIVLTSSSSSRRSRLQPLPRCSVSFSGEPPTATGGRQDNWIPQPLKHAALSSRVRGISDLRELFGVTGWWLLGKNTPLGRSQFRLGTRGSWHLLKKLGHLIPSSEQVWRLKTPRGARLNNKLENLYTMRTWKYVMNRDIESILHAMIMSERKMKRFIRGILCAMILNQ
uniref:Uncharacterized protein n=1 Tax=Cucumis melo TaxID=3656 RepID=A0A9I9EG95_CUCME